MAKKKTTPKKAPAQASGAKRAPVSEAMRLLDTRAKGKFKENVQDFVDTFGASLPPGTYNTRLSQAILYKNRAGDPQVDFIFVVTDGEHEGAQIRDMHSIAARGKRTIDLCLRMIAGRLQRLGRETNDVSGAAALDAHCKALTAAGPAVAVTIKDDEYGNIGSIALIGSGGNGQVEGSADQEDQEDDSGDETSWEVGARVTVNDPNDEDCPWNGEIVSINNDQEVEVKQDDTGDEWVVQTQHLSPE